MFIWMAPVIIGSSIWQWRQHQWKKQVKREILHALPEEELLVLTFSKTELHSLDWKHSKEFKWKGDYYDVVKKHETNDSTVFWVWPDEEENKIWQLGMRLFKKEPIAKNPYPLWMPLAIIPMPFTASSDKVIAILYNCTIHFLYNSLNQRPNSPPPEIEM